VLPADVKLDPDKAWKYVTIDGNKMSCGAPENHFSRYKNLKRLALLLYTCLKAHAWKPDILSDIVAAGGSGAACGGPPDVQQATSQECLNFATSVLRSCMPFDQFNTSIGDRHWRKFRAGDLSGLSIVGESVGSYGCNRRPP